MPMIPLGNEQQILQARSPIELFDNETGRALGNALENLGGMVSQIKQENEQSAVGVASEEYEYNARLEMDRASEEYKSMDPSITNFEDFIRPRLDKLSTSIEEKYGLQGNLKWKAAAKGKENNLIPSFMTAEAKEALARKKELEMAESALIAEQIYTSKSPSDKFSEFSRKAELQIEQGIASGKYLPEQREALLMQKRMELTVGTLDAFTTRNQYQEALAFLDSKRENFDTETFRSERDRLLSKFKNYEDERDIKQKRFDEALEKKRKEIINATEIALLAEKENIGNDPIQLVTWMDKIQSKLSTGELDVAARNRLVQADVFAGSMTDSKFEGDLYEKLVQNKITLKQAVQEINSAPISVEKRASLISKMNQLLEDQANRGERFNQRLSDASIEYIESVINRDVRSRLDQKSADSLSAKVKVDVAALENRFQRALTPVEIDRELKRVALEQGINLTPETQSNLGASNSSIDVNKRQLDRLRNKLQQNKNTLTPEQKSRIIKEIESLDQIIKFKTKEQGAIK